MGALPKTSVAIATALSLLAYARAPRAFPYVVQDGETVAAIAERTYGRVELERVVVAANSLDARRGSIIVAGQRLELPAVGYHKVLPGDSWQSIAAARLGAERRGDVLATLNDSHPWLPPEIGREVLLPYNLRVVADSGDTTESLAYRFRGRRDDAWVVASYNGLRRARLRQGEVLLVPLSDLELTDAGRQAATMSGALVQSEAGGAAREAQREADRELPKLAQEVRRGSYIEAVVRGAGLLTRGGLSEPQLATAYRLLTVAYVALDARGLAATACLRWRQHDPTVVLDPIDHSPKILDVCLGGLETAYGDMGVGPEGAPAALPTNAPLQGAADAGVPAAGTAAPGREGRP